MKFFEVRDLFVKSINSKTPAPKFSCNALQDNQILTLDENNFYLVKTFDEKGEVISTHRYIPSSADNYREFNLI